MQLVSLVLYFSSCCWFYEFWILYLPWVLNTLSKLRKKAQKDNTDKGTITHCLTKFNKNLCVKSLVIKFILLITCNKNIVNLISIFSHFPRNIYFYSKKERNTLLFCFVHYFPNTRNQSVCCVRVFFCLSICCPSVSIFLLYESSSTYSICLSHLRKWF